ncbi:DUF1540 domain-containing protein [Vulcanibacillus modesticaldus]|uniref:DUF1540 domain-containing protein n=1 Tax=Vulcanibacillus modesticaldus TaxID=337097 RepID=A0A1D2YUW7_9BACI|nr:DUF1540 domain-containing protein [Vulcanibacillus modesticaldus]OEF99461.1 DUF1540 domain-containing protein [Vulcanibacillus modesticaldus]
MAKDVMCEVSNCQYWEQGNRCTASSINVVGHRSPSDSRETDCSTFVARA